MAVREGRRELASEVGQVSERTRFKSSSRSIRARSRAFRSIAPGVGSDEGEVSLAHRESCADFPEVPLQLLDGALQRTLMFLHCFLCHASTLCVWLQGRFCLIVQVDTVRIELHSDKGSLP